MSHVVDMKGNTLQVDGITATGAIASSAALNGSAAGIRTKQAVNDISSATVPTAAELTTSFGAPATLGRGFIGTVDDADGDTNFYIVAASDASFYFLKMTKAT